MTFCPVLTLQTKQMCTDDLYERKLDSSFYGSWPALDWTPRGLWSIRKVQRLQTHGQPDGQPTSAAPSSSRLQLATNSKATDIIFWACRCGSWGSCGPQRCTYKVRTCICVMSGLIPDMQVVQMKPVSLNRLIQLTCSLGPFWRTTPPVG